MSDDAGFTGSIPEKYDTFLVPVLFEPYAADLVAHAVAVPARDILEIAAGTGAVTAPLAAALPDARIVATDLNAAMIARGEALHPAPNLRWEVADAQALPFAEARFDLVLCQFGAMFFPDRVLAYREMRRVLRPGGRLLFNVWDSLARNPGSATVHAAFRDGLPEPKPGFLARTPFGYHDPAAIEADLTAAGFHDIAITPVRAQSPQGSGEKLLRGLVEGSPLAAEIAGHDPVACAAARERALAALTTLEAAGPLAMSALRISATG